MRRRLKNWYEAYIGKVIPRYAFFSVIFCFVFNSLIYTGTQIIMKDAKHYDLSTPFDYSVPFIPGWVLVYVICFGFWAANYIIITREGNEDWFKFATGDYLSRVGLRGCRPPPVRGRRPDPGERGPDLGERQV